MEVFISWSGPPAKAVAAELREWLPAVYQNLEPPFFSDQDIAAGSVWREEIREALKRAAFCIVCVTRQSMTSPWVNYEIGAIHEGFRKPVCPYLIGVEPSELASLPLSHFQAEPATLDGTLKLLKALNQKAQKPIGIKILERAFRPQWEALAKVIQDQETLAQATGAAPSPGELGPDYSPLTLDDDSVVHVLENHLDYIGNKDTLIFVDLERKLRLPPGSAHRLLSRAAKDRFDVELARDTARVVRKPRPAAPRRRGAMEGGGF